MAKETENTNKNLERFVGVPEEFEFVGLEEDVVVLEPEIEIEIEPEE